MVGQASYVSGVYLREGVEHDTVSSRTQGGGSLFPRPAWFCTRGSTTYGPLGTPSLVGVSRVFLHWHGSSDGQPCSTTTLFSSRHLEAWSGGCVMDLASCVLARTVLSCTVAYSNVACDTCIRSPCQPSRLPFLPDVCERVSPASSSANLRGRGALFCLCT